MRVTTPSNLLLKSHKQKALAIDGSAKLVIIYKSCWDRPKFCPHTVSKP
jgi:hypothetical protein